MKGKKQVSRLLPQARKALGRIFGTCSPDSTRVLCLIVPRHREPEPRKKYVTLVSNRHRSVSSLRCRHHRLSDAALYSRVDGYASYCSSLWVRSVKRLWLKKFLLILLILDLLDRSVSQQQQQQCRHSEGVGMRDWECESAVDLSVSGIEATPQDLQLLEQHLKLAVDVLTSKSGPKRVLQAARALLLSLSYGSPRTRLVIEVVKTFNRNNF